MERQTSVSLTTPRQAHDGKASQEREIDRAGELRRIRRGGGRPHRSRTVADEKFHRDVEGGESR